MSFQKDVHDILAKEVGHLRANELVAGLSEEITGQISAGVVNRVLNDLGEHLLQRHKGSTSMALAALDAAAEEVESR